MLQSVLTGRYRIERLLGRGGFGETYLATDLYLPEPYPCVVKHLNPRKALTPASIRLFNKEAEILYKLGSHPQIPRLLAHFEQDGELYLVQEYVKGHDLDREVGPNRIWTAAAVVELLVEVLEILTYVHQQGVIHRDIKPPNLMRRDSDGKLMLIDFGSVKQLGPELLARQADPDADEQAAWTVGIHSKGYSPLEQLEGRPRLNSDIYALGMIGIQCLTGILPMDLPRHQGTFEVLWRHESGRAYGSHQVVDLDLAEVLSKMVLSHPANRYPSAVEALAALRSLCQPVEDPPSEPGDPAPPPLVQVKGKIPARGGLWGALRQGKAELTIRLSATFGGHPGGVRALAWGGNRLISAGSDRVIKVWGQEQAWLSLRGHAGTIYALAVDPQGRWLASSSDDKTIRLWSLADGRQMRLWQRRADWAGCLVAGAEIVVSGHSDHSLKLWDLGQDQPLATLHGHSSEILALCLAGQTLISASQDGSIRLWNIARRQAIGPFGSHVGPVNTLASDGRILVSGSNDGQLKVWNLDEGRLLRSIVAHTGRITALSLTGGLICSGGSDRSVKLWDLPSGAAIATLRGYSSAVTALAAQPGMVASGSWDGAIRLWQLAQESAAETAN